MKAESKIKLQVFLVIFILCLLILGALFGYKIWQSFIITKHKLELKYNNLSSKININSADAKEYSKIDIKYKSLPESKKNVNAIDRAYIYDITSKLSKRHNLIDFDVSSIKKIDILKDKTLQDIEIDIAKTKISTFLIELEFATMFEQNIVNFLEDIKTEGNWHFVLKTYKISKHKSLNQVLESISFSKEPPVINAKIEGYVYYLI